MVSPAGRTKERWRRLTLELDRLRQPVVVIGNWRTGPGTILHINPAWIQTTGLTASEMLGHPATNFVFSPENDREAYRNVRRTVARGNTASASLLRVRKGSRPIDIRLRAWSVKLARDTQDYLIAAEITGTGNTDATQHPAADIPAGKLLSFERPNGGNGRAEDLRHAEDLINAQQQFQHSLETCAFGVERIDTTGRILYANPIYHEMLGYAENDLIGENIYQRLLDPVQARAQENYIRHIVAMEPPVTPLFTSYRRKDGTPIHLRLDWAYDRSVSGVTIGLISIVTPVAGWPTGNETGVRRSDTTGETPSPEEPPTEHTESGDDYSRARLLQQTLHAARVWASILAHHHPEGEDAQIVAKVDNAIDDAMRLLGADRRPTIPAASYYEETAPLQGLVVAVVEPVSILRASLTDLLRSWGCNPVGIDEPAETIPTLERTGRVPDMMIVNLDAAIGVSQDSVVREVWQRYGAGIPCALVAETVAPEIEKFAESVGMKIVRQPVHPIELRSTMLALRREAPKNRRK